MFYSFWKKYVVKDILKKLNLLKSNKRLLDRSPLAPDSDDWKHKALEKGFVHAPSSIYGSWHRRMTSRAAVLQHGDMPIINGL